MAMMVELSSDTDTLLSGLLKMGISEKSPERPQTTYKDTGTTTQNFVRLNDPAHSQSNMQKQNNVSEPPFDAMIDFRNNGVEAEYEDLNKSLPANAHVRVEGHALPPCYDREALPSPSSKASLEAYRRYLQPGLPRQLSYPDDVYTSSQLKLKDQFYASQSQSMNAIDQDNTLEMLLRNGNVGVRPTPMHQWRLSQQLQSQQQLNATSPPFTPRRYRLNIQKPLCGFCKKNGEAVTWYTSHNLKEPNGKILCPVLRAFQCPECQATGDSAHTIRYCPKNEKNDAFQSMMNMKYMRTSPGKRRGSGPNMSPPSHNLSPNSSPFFPPQYLDVEKANGTWNNQTQWNGQAQWFPVDNSGTKLYSGMMQNQPINIPRRTSYFQY